MSDAQTNNNTTAFDIMESSLRNNLPDFLEAFRTTPLGTVYECAVVHALRDLGLISAQGQFNEEDRTASLVGHLGSHLSWYLAISDLSGRNTTQPSVSWAYQSKKAEAEKGGDFGLAVRLADDVYNIAFFQAKKADLSKVINVWRAPHGYETPKEGVTAEQVKSNKIDADTELANAIQGSVSMQSGKGQHQFVKLAVLAQNAKDVSSDGSWIHYAVWPEDSSQGPISFSFPAMQKILQGWNITKGKALNVSTENQKKAEALAALLMRGDKCNSSGWLTVDKKRAQNIVGNLTELCNILVIVEDRQSGGGLVDDLKNQKFDFIEHNRPIEGVTELEPQAKPATTNSLTRI